jgi:pre-mRNA-processing factor 40
LLENNDFKSDISLLGMDKEDALIVFEEYIRALEIEDVEDRDNEKKRQKRLQRKNRDNFLCFLDTLHEDGKLTSMSLWIELYPSISSDLRFSAMLGQPGSTPLDLFKFYVDQLKANFNSDKRLIKEIMKERKFVIETSTTFEKFATVVCEDQRSASLDAGNVKLTYNSLIEKAELLEKERVKEESRRLRKLENEVKNHWLDTGLSASDSWEKAKATVVDKIDFEAYDKELKIEDLWKQFINESENTCNHHHSRSKKSKKSRKHKKRSHSASSEELSNVEEIHHSEAAVDKKKKKKRKMRDRSHSSELSSVEKDQSSQETSPSIKKVSTLKCFTH